MNGEKRLDPINILLSREELLFVLNSLQADFIPGLDPDPQGELTLAQESFGITVAGRALRARELARQRPGGEIELHTALLTMVGVCVYSQNVLFAYHWPANTDTPSRYFGHIRGNDIVAHTRPEEVLHLFSLLPDKDQLTDQVLAVCQYTDVPAAAALEFSAPAEIFAQVRQLAGAGDAAKAVNLLVNSGVAAETARTFADALAHAPRVSILQAVKQPGDGTVQKRDFTLLQNGQQAWLAVAAAEPGAPLRVKTTSSAEIRAMLAEWV
ncbi:MAG: hypothetical protein KJ077_19165 [Anaerolineae bacterium]|nr:hypothetical protein [Anaerolineae bacterium]